jgi:hypothetical protein
LLFVPIALYRPRISGLWAVPLVLWLAPSTYSEGVTWRILLGLGTVAIVGAGVAGIEMPTVFGRRFVRTVVQK